MTKHKQNTFIIISTLIVLIGFSTVFSFADNLKYDWSEYYYQPGVTNIKNVNGKFYAYIVLLFNENPHFVNLIQKDSIPLKVIGNEGFHVKEYKRYLNSMRHPALKTLVRTMMDIYLEPARYSDAQLGAIQKQLSGKNIVLRFSRDRNLGVEKIILDYCIFGKKIGVTIKHPFFKTKEKIYNIQPFIYYDEFSTSNSTFYFDMIYINPEEVQNDYIIAKKIMNGKDVKSMFFVGSRVTEDIKKCLLKAFVKNSSIKDEIWKMFIIHELTHKILNNRYNYFDQVSGEELSLCSTIYANPYLGISVMYSYLNYNAINPHRIAAMNLVRFIGNKTGKTAILKDPSLVKKLPREEIRQISKEYFVSVINKFK
ncbi:MAG: hypothetical protein GY754_43725 [bacterium]|nr:hypothetical protein [bacterium]